MSAGKADMHVDGQTFRLQPGDTVVVAPLEQHSMDNTCTIDVEYIVIGISSGRDGRTVVVVDG